jgi:hypothetical protein
MNESQRNNEVETTEVNGTQPVLEPAPAHAVYIYESSGITEHKGNVPAWLWVVAVALAIWGIYYLVVYWNAPDTLI